MTSTIEYIAQIALSTIFALFAALFLVGYALASLCLIIIDLFVHFDPFNTKECHHYR